jgi:hypothetical protein
MDEIQYDVESAEGSTLVEAPPIESPSLSESERSEQIPEGDAQA